MLRVMHDSLYASKNCGMERGAKKDGKQSERNPSKRSHLPGVYVLDPGTDNAAN